MLPILTLILFSAGAGIFTTLSALERRAYPLFWNGEVPEAEIRRIQSVLGMVVDILPKMMMVIVFGSGVLILIQALTGHLGPWALTIGVIYGVFLALILLKLFATIKSVKETDAINGPIEKVRPLTRDAMIVHHYGLALAAVMIPLFWAVVV